MKKIICFLIVTMLLFSIAYAENTKIITFLGIPWLSDDVTVKQMLTDKGYLHQGSSGIKMDNCYYLISASEGSIEQMENGQYKDYCRSISYNDSVMGRIAGCPIKNIILSFAYDGSYQLVYVEVELLGGTYADIKQKMERVYNTGEEFETDLGYQITAWRGNDNSCALLITYDEGMTFNLYYGRTDAAEILEKCSITDPNDVSGL